jgi:hypothetical protein
LNRKEHAIGIFCDISKAFDCDSHELLLMKLQYYGVQGILFQWFKSYHQERRQRVELKYSNSNYYSEWELVQCRVPQGSVEISTFSDVIMFADDTSILCTAKDCNNLKSKLNAVFTHMSRWFQSNEFALNLDKTKMINFIPTSATSHPLHTLFFLKKRWKL